MIPAEDARKPARHGAEQVELGPGVGADVGVGGPHQDRVHAAITRVHVCLDGVRVCVRVCVCVCVCVCRCV